MSDPPKRGRKNGAARKLSKSVENTFDAFWLFWRFLPCAKIAEKSRKKKLFDTFWRFFDVFWRGPFPPAPFAIHWRCDAAADAAAADAAASSNLAMAWPGASIPAVVARDDGTDDSKSAQQSSSHHSALGNFSRVHAKGVVLCERACFCLLSAFYNTPPPSKNPSKNPCPYWKPYKVPSKNPSKKALPLKNLLRTLLRSVRLHDPLGVRPI